MVFDRTCTALKDAAVQAAPSTYYPHTKPSTPLFFRPGKCVITSWNKKSPISTTITKSIWRHKENLPPTFCVKNFVLWGATLIWLIRKTRVQKGVNLREDSTNDQAKSRKLIQLLGKSIYDNRRKIRKNMLSSLSFLTYRDQSCLGTLNKLLETMRPTDLVKPILYSRISEPVIGSWILCM